MYMPKGHVENHESADFEKNATSPVIIFDHYVHTNDETASFMIFDYS